jgi:hypothetical protein
MGLKLFGDPKRCASFASPRTDNQKFAFWTFRGYRSPGLQFFGSATFLRGHDLAIKTASIVGDRQENCWLS